MDDDVGPPPPLARIATWSYAAVGIVLVVGGVVATIVRKGNLLVFWVSLAGYCAVLAFGASRLRTPSERAAVSPWICVPLLLHALAGLLGAAGLFAWGHEARERIAIVAVVPAVYGLFFGWIPALLAFVFVRRGLTLLLAAVAGPLVVLLLRGS